jgi:hypothetical protein
MGGVAHFVCDLSLPREITRSTIRKDTGVLGLIQAVRYGHRLTLPLAEASFGPLQLSSGEFTDYCPKLPIWAPRNCVYQLHDYFDISHPCLKPVDDYAFGRKCEIRRRNIAHRQPI